MKNRVWVLVVLTVFVVAGIILLRESSVSKDVAGKQSFDESLFTDWKDFRSVESGFEVKVPSLPQNAREFFQDKTVQQKRFYNIFVTEKPNGSIFTIIIIKYPKGEAQSTSSLVQGVVDEMMKSNPKNRVVDMKKIQFQNQDALKFDIINEQMQMNGIAFSRDDSIIILSYSAHAENHLPQEYEYFIHSFKLLK